MFGVLIQTKNSYKWQCLFFCLFYLIQLEKKRENNKLKFGFLLLLIQSFLRRAVSHISKLKKLIFPLNKDSQIIKDKY